MLNPNFNKRKSFLLKLIHENKSLINEHNDSSEEDDVVKNGSNDVNKCLDNIRDNKESNLIHNNEYTGIVGNAYYFSKFHDQKQSSNNNNDVKKVLILYTGGTFGMEKSEYGLRPQSNFLLNYMFNHSNFCDKEYTYKNSNADNEFDINKDFLITPETIIGRRIYYKIFEFDSIIDSSNMNLEYWRKIGRSIEKFYYKYDSFIILHGTDTMNYTASILSFMLENLNKLVILTGSQIPLVEMRNDAQKNLIDALTIAGTYDIPEVCLLFDSKLFRGNRTIKNDNINLDAFESPNLPPLVKIGINIKINWDLILPKKAENFNYFENINNNICIIKFFPIINDETFASFFQPPIQAVIIETYGTGNVPSNRPFILEVLKNAKKNGITIVNVSQCRKGLVGESSYSGNLLESLGVINAWDMTVECALAKLSYLLGKNYDANKIKILFEQDMRGEITMRKQELFSLYSNTYINSILNLIGLDKSNEENFTLAQSLLPTIIKSSVERNDLRILQNMKNEISNISYQSYSKKSPLHISSKLGFYEVTDFLISSRLYINELDYNGYTPLDYACEYKNKEVAYLIKLHGGVLNHNLNNAVLFNQLAFDGDLDTLKILHYCGSNLLSVDYDARNVSHIAASEGKSNIIDYLLNELKLDIISKDRWGNTPYSEGNREIKELIMKRYKIEKIVNDQMKKRIKKRKKDKIMPKGKLLNNKRQRDQN